MRISDWSSDVCSSDLDGLSCWVNRCAHRGAQVCRELRGNARSHACVYHQWGYSAKGDLLGVPFRRGQNGMAGMPADFKTEEHGLQQVRVARYRGLVFGTFRPDTPQSEERWVGKEGVSTCVY